MQRQVGKYWPKTAEHQVSRVRRPALAPECSVWLSVEQIRKMQRMRRTAVIAAMHAGELPFERRGRIRYARLSDIIAWEETKLHSRRFLAGIPSARTLLIWLAETDGDSTPSRA